MSYLASWERSAERRGKKQGKIEGIDEKSKETAKRMLEDGMPIGKISKYTGLSENEIEKLSSISH